MVTLAPLKSGDAALVAASTLLDAVDLVVLSIPPHSRVLQIGIEEGTFARKLAARACHLWAIDLSGPASASDVWCEAVVHGDFQAVDVGSLLGTARVDAVLVIDELQRFGEPADVVRRIAQFVAPGGRFLFCNVHGSELAEFYGFLNDEGLRVLESVPVERATGKRTTDVGTIDRYVVVAGLAAVPQSEVLPTLASVLIERLRVVERECHDLRDCARDTNLQLARHEDEANQLNAALKEAREAHRRSADELLKAQDALRRLEVKRHDNRRQLDAVTSELSSCQVQLRFLRDDVVVKDAYLATLREEAAHHQRTLDDCHAARRDESAQRHSAVEELHVIRGRLNEEITQHAAAAERNVELSRLNDDLRHTLEATTQELHRVHVAVATALAQPRYVIAERLNGWVRRLQFVHAPLKRAWLARHPR